MPTPPTKRQRLRDPYTGAIMYLTDEEEDELLSKAVLMAQRDIATPFDDYEEQDSPS